MKAAKTITAQDSQSTMSPQPPTVELQPQDTVTYQCTERLTDTPHVPSINTRESDQVSYFKAPSLPSLIPAILLLVSISRGPLTAQQAWDDHADRMKELERRYPSRYGLYLRDKHAPIVIGEEYEPETKPRK